MKCRIFTILSALSLLLFMAVVVLWMRSYASPKSFVLGSATSAGIETFQGYAALSIAVADGRFPDRIRLRVRPLRDDWLDGIWESFDTDNEWVLLWKGPWGITFFVWESGKYYIPGMMTPMWLILAITAVLPALWLTPENPKQTAPPW